MNREIYDSLGRLNYLSLVIHLSSLSQGQGLKTSHNSPNLTQKNIENNLTCIAYYKAWDRFQTEHKHGENDFVASTKRFVNIGSANQNSCGNDFTYYGDDCTCNN